jgi:hypothetical protein
VAKVELDYENTSHAGAKTAALGKPTLQMMHSIGCNFFQRRA